METQPSKTRKEQIRASGRRDPGERGAGSCPSQQRRWWGKIPGLEGGRGSPGKQGGKERRSHGGEERDWHTVTGGDSGGRSGREAGLGRDESETGGGRMNFRGELE